MVRVTTTSDTVLKHHSVREVESACSKWWAAKCQAIYYYYFLNQALSLKQRKVVPIFAQEEMPRLTQSSQDEPLC